MMVAASHENMIPVARVIFTCLAGYCGFHDYCVDFSWEFTHWARCCMCWATERRSWYEKEQGKGGARRLSLRPLLLTARVLTTIATEVHLGRLHQRLVGIDKLA
ncbi:hypothetical protein Sjap_007336 [Stephania japonica]|uniref:Uncharacterized protein n=1 Tax=Stephania japonica TaxID=461633 RepID=A0AAP0JPU0_9MAGN